jgi:hypothetical protein
MVMQYFFALNAAASFVRHDIIDSFPSKEEFLKHEAAMYSSEIQAMNAMSFIFGVQLERDGFMRVADSTLQRAYFDQTARTILSMRDNRKLSQLAVREMHAALGEWIEDMDDDDDEEDDDLDDEDSSGEEGVMTPQEQADVIAGMAELDRCSQCKGRTEVLKRDREDLPTILGTTRGQIDEAFNALGEGTEALLCLDCGHASIKGPKQAFGSWAKIPRN